MTDVVRAQAALLSVRPRFATALLDGSKTVELRRRRARLAHGAICLLYASSPQRALVGAIRVAETDTDSPDVLWQRWGSHTALNRSEYDSYLAGCTHACAIVIASAVRFSEPLTLSELRRRRGTSFVTPQSYRFLGADEYRSLLNGEAAQLRELARSERAVLEPRQRRQALAG